MTSRKKIIPVVLAGGTGTRLWPLSRKSYPKQFTKLVGDQTLFQQTASRLISSDLVQFDKQITVTNAEFRFVISEQLQEIGVDPGPIILEPEVKNTAPAVLAATFYALQNDPEAVLLVLPSDHVIPDIDAFHKAISLGLLEINLGNIITFGVKPISAETGYGYLELANCSSGNMAKIDRFIEKPDLKTAKKFIASGNYLWNSGIFMFQACDMVNAFMTSAPNLISPVKKSIEHGKIDLGFFRLDPTEWEACENVSIDYAVMEKLNKIVAIPLSTHWSDLGNWSAVWDENSKDENGNVNVGKSIPVDCTETFLRAEGEGMQVVGLGLKDMMVIAMPDSVLVAHKSRAQDVKLIVSELKKKDISQAEFFPKFHRPWGWFEILSKKRRFQVKRIMVKPGGALSLQSHKYRSEHWVVVEGKAKVIVESEEKFLEKGESVYVPIGAVHRMENPGYDPMLLIEVQTGTYLGEDDIIRYDDIYSRI